MIKKKIGIIGSGFVAGGLAKILEQSNDLQAEKIYTKSDINKRNDFPFQDKLTNSLQEIIDTSDLVVECTGDPISATENIEKVINAGIPVVTMNSEFHVTTGSYFVGKGILTEAEGDQPGCTAALYEEALSMGFEPVVFGNIKGFLNTTPKQEEMEFWAGKKGISVEMTTSFTDGTKVQIEQAFTANGLGATIARKGLLGVEVGDVKKGGDILGAEADKIGTPISDYILSPQSPPGVFITAKHKKIHNQALEYLKMGDGPYYTLIKDYHLVYFEIPKTIRRILNGGSVLLDNSSNPSISVATIAKKELNPGDKIIKGIGSFSVRGEALKIKEMPNHLPIGLCNHITIKRKIERGQCLTFDDVELNNNRALEIWHKIIENI